MATLLPRRIAGAAASLVVTAVSVTALAAPAQAEEGYQYWNYFHLDGEKWAFAETGPNDHQPADGDVEGFRFGTSTVSQGIEPRADLTEVNFDTVCADAEAAEGEKRVAVLLDYGVEEDQGTPPEPRAECAVVDEGASTQQLLGEVAELRVETGMICAVDGYPATGCAATVKNPEIPAAQEAVAFTLPGDNEGASTDDQTASADDGAAEEESNLLWPLLGVGALVVLIAAAGVALNRRRTA